MRKYPPLCFCLLLAWVLPAHAQQSSDKKQTNPRTLTQDARQEVLDLEKKWVEAEIKHDETTLVRILDDKFVVSFGAAKPYDKEALSRRF